MRKSLIIALFAAAAITGHAADIDSLAATIASANPAVRARQAELRSASLAASADAMLPGPEIEGEHLWGPSGDNRWGVGISQSFDWPGVYAAKRGARRAADNAFVQLAHAELAEQRLAAKLALIDLVAARREAATVRDIYNNVQEFLDLTRRALDHGQATILDVRKLQIEQLEVGRRLEEAEQARAEALAALRAMGCDTDVPDALDYPAASADYADAAARWMASPALMAARAEADASAARAKAAARSCLPGFSLGYRHQYEGGTHFNGLSVGIALPAWGASRSKAAARAEAGPAALQAEAQTAATASQFDAQRRRVVALGERLEAYDGALATSDYPALLRKSLDGGQISMLTYIQELNFFMEARIAREQAARDYHLALATLNKYAF